MFDYLKIVQQDNINSIPINSYKGHLVIAELGYPGLLTSILHLGMNPVHTVIRTG